MKIKSSWASTDEVCAAIGIGKTRLKDLKASGELIAGKHWVYKSGRKSSPIGWDLEAIRLWQIEQAQEISNASLQAANDIETYSPLGVLQ